MCLEDKVRIVWLAFTWDFTFYEGFKGHKYGPAANIMCMMKEGLDIFYGGLETL